MMANRGKYAVIAALVVVTAACSSQVVRRGGGTTGGSAGKAIKVSTPKYGQTAVVQRGETVYRIATNNGITALDLALWNNIPAPYTIWPGQRLRLYPGGAGTPARPATASSSGSGSVSRPAANATAPAAAPVATPTSSPFNWRWPTDGQIIGRFVNGDPTRQGLDIAGNSGQSVRAAADGVVVYSGSGLVGYGELIIVKHNEQWLSAYGHNRTRQVNEGQLVKAGQQIAEMGRTGAARDMLHFEIRYNGKPVDPQQYLPKR